MRSDTLTLPSPGMMEAMMNAPVGDDVYGEDPSVNALQDRIATAFGKPAALFLLSGSMGNLVSIKAHCTQRGAEVILGSRCHVHIYEQGSIATIAGVHHRTVENLPDGTFNLDAARQLIRSHGDPHYPKTQAILIENTHNACGGRVLPLSFLKEVRSLADEFGLSVHMDGARLLNAATALNIEPKEIVQHVDSVSMCFSKGIGAPLGAIVAGSEAFVERTLYHRKALGGGMRQAGMMAAAAQYGFDRARDTMRNDHRRARMLATGLVQAVAGSDLLWLEPDSVDSNMVFLRCISANRLGLGPAELSARLGRVSAWEEAEFGTDGVCVVKCLPASADGVRLVVNWNQNDEDMTLVVGKVRAVLAEMSRETASVGAAATN